MKRAHFSAAAASILSAIAACGGGGSTTPDAATTHKDAPVVTIDSNTTIDSSTTIDAPHADSGVGIDSALIDSGVIVDSNGIDSGTMIDGGTTIDSGSMADGGTGTCVPTVIALGTQDYLTGSVADMQIAWDAPITTALGDGGPAQLNFEFYTTGSDNLAVPVDLSMGNQANYGTCAACMHALSADSTGTIVREYFQSGGTMSLTEDPLVTGSMKGTITNLTMVEVTVDQSTFTSTLVPGGKCISIGTIALNHGPVPNAWTCAAAAYHDGANCDCMCGVVDPDCSITAAPVVGCTSGQVCDSAVCLSPGTNDTCQTAQALTVGTAVKGNTFNATSNYASGLEGATCTNATQTGADVAYSVALTAGTSYTFALTNVDTNFDPSISLVGPGAAAVCDVMPVACLAGADTGLEGAAESFQFTPTTTGTYFVIVDTFWGPPHAVEMGAFTVKVSTP